MNFFSLPLSVALDSIIHPETIWFREFLGLRYKKDTRFKMRIPVRHESILILHCDLDAPFPQEKGALKS